MTFMRFETDGGTAVPTSSYTGLCASGATWRDAYWNLLGAMLLHPVLVARSFRMAFVAKCTGDFDDVRFVRVRRYR